MGGLVSIVSYSVLNVKALVGAFSVIVKTGCGTGCGCATSLHRNQQSDDMWKYALPDWAILCTPSFLKVFKCCLSNYSFLEIPTVNKNSIFHFEMLRTFQSEECF